MESKDTDSLPVTEQENPRTTNLSGLPLADVIRLMNDEDAAVAGAVSLVLPQVEEAVAGIVERLTGRGRLFYIGTGTSGRLGVLDAAECPPTFGVSESLVQAVIAGGYEACHRAVEASEDDAWAAQRDLVERGFAKEDALVGIAASGQTPYTVGAVSYGRSLGAFTVALSCAPESLITRVAQVSIVPVVGPEVVTGSTRLKSGTAQKMVLNMISTATLAKLGYVSGNRMSNLRARNKKLHQRAVRVIMAETGLNEDGAEKALSVADGDTTVALVMTLAGCAADAARDALTASMGVVRGAVERLINSSR